MLDAYLAVLQAAGKPPVTIKNYRTRLERFLSWMTAENSANDVVSVTKHDLVAYRDHLQHERKLSPKTVNTALSTLNSFYTWLCKEGYISFNPLSGVSRVEEGQAGTKWLSKSEAYRVSRAALSDGSLRNAAIILTLLYAGPRTSELVNIKPDDVQLAAGKGHILLHGRRPRVIPIPQALRQVLGPYIVKHRSTGEWLFSSQRGERLSPKGVEHICADIGKTAGVRRLTPRTLRHTYCRQLISMGVSVAVVAKLSGATFQATLKYCDPDLSKKGLQAAIEKLCD